MCMVVFELTAYDGGDLYDNIWHGCVLGCIVLHDMVLVVTCVMYVMKMYYKVLYVCYVCCLMCVWCVCGVWVGGRGCIAWCDVVCICVLCVECIYIVYVN